MATPRKGEGIQLGVLGMNQKSSGRRVSFAGLTLSLPEGRRRPSKLEADPTHLRQQGNPQTRLPVMSGAGTSPDQYAAFDLASSGRVSECPVST